jgi:Peptidase family M48
MVLKRSISSDLPAARFDRRIGHGFAQVESRVRMTNMMRVKSRARGSTALVASVVALTVVSSSAQTRIQPHSNSFKPEQDVELGQQAAKEVRQQYPLLNDEEIHSYVVRLGDQLVDNIPEDLRQPAFRYTFEVVNLKEINAFALPGGPMFLNRGMLDAARTDGEVAGVMAHELSHVVLRHGTAQATKGQKFQMGALAGQVLGAIVGGRTGSVIAQGSQFGLGAYFLKFSREYEREADLMGAQIMARAGYDPRQMANMFQTIQKQGGSQGPEWLSDHPDPGNRYEAISREAEALGVARSNAPAGRIESVHARLAKLPPAISSEQAARQAQRRQRESQVGQSGGRRPGGIIEAPASEWRTYQPGSFLRLSVPANWQQIGSGNTVTYAPEGGYVQTGDGHSAFTHGLEVGITQGSGGSLQQSTEQLLQSFARTNPDLRRQGGYSRTTIGGRLGLTTTLSNVSEVTGESEAVNLSTVQLQDGSVLFMIGVAPQGEAQVYLNTFGRVRQSVQIANAGR